MIPKIILALLIVFFIYDKIGLLRHLPKGDVLSIIVYNLLITLFFSLHALNNFIEGDYDFMSVLSIIVFPFFFIGLMLKLTIQNFKPSQSIIFNADYHSAHLYRPNSSQMNFIPYQRIQGIIYINESLKIDEKTNEELAKLKTHKKEEMIRVFDNLKTFSPKKEDANSMFNKFGNEYIYIDMKYQELYFFMRVFKSRFDLSKKFTYTHFCGFFKIVKSDGSFGLINYNTIMGSKSRVDDYTRSVIFKIFD